MGVLPRSEPCSNRGKFEIKTDERVFANFAGNFGASPTGVGKNRRVGRGLAGVGVEVQVCI